MRSISLTFFIIFLVGGEMLHARETAPLVTIELDNEQKIEWVVNSEDRFVDVLDQIQTCYAHYLAQKAEGEDHSALHDISVWNLTMTYAGLTARAKQEPKRDYYAEVTKSDKADIAFIVETLAYDSAITVWNKESELKKAGDRIHSVHPLNFLNVVFSSDKLIAGIVAIKGRNIVPKIKKEFFKGLVDTLEEEGEKNNLLPHLDDFAEKLDVNKKKLLPSLKGKKYQDFIDMLIELKPRKDADRHNM